MLIRLLLSMILLLVSCAHKNTSPDSKGDNGEVAEKSTGGGDDDEEDIKPLVQVKEVESFRVTDPQPPQVQSDELEQIPVEVNEKVEQWIKYFQGRGRHHMERYLSRMTQYSELMKRILRRNGLPEDLIYVALIESGFSSKATSHAAAVGYWQFIRGTGKRYGLEINTLVDERRDPVLSTQAAAEYFKGLYSVFGSWYLAMASYNVGENRVKREVMRNFTRDFWTLAKKKRLPKETINYVPKFIAAKLIGRDPAKYGFTDIDYEKPVEFELVRVDRPINLKILATKMGLDYDDFKQLNPKFRGEVAPTKDAGILELRVPIGASQLALDSSREAIVEKIEYVADTGETIHYKVRSGDSLFSIARKFKTSINWIKDVNDLKAGKKLRIGQRLVVPEPGSGSGRKKLVVKADTKVPNKLKEKEDNKKKEVAQQEKETATDNAEVVKGGNLYYVVQPGDTLSEIAEEYDSTIRELRKMNKLSRNSLLRPGMKLRVPKEEEIPADPNESQAQNSDSNKKEDSAEDETRYIVQAGENLSDIAKKHGVSVDAIKKANRIRDEDEIKAGAKLLIPKNAEGGSPEEKSPKSVESSSHRRIHSKTVAHLKPQAKGRALGVGKRKVVEKVYIVRRGDNLIQIAQKHKVSLLELQVKNKIKKGTPLYVGTKLYIPRR